MAAVEAAAAATLERLEALSCPPVLGCPPLAPPAALALLCRPSGPRRALLRWLWARIHPPLSAHLESLSEEAEMREMAELGAQLMLCGAQDLELLQGTAPPEQQLRFLQDLLDAAPPPETPPNSRPPSSSPLLLQLLETPEGGAALRPPHPPPVQEELGETPPKARRPLPELEAELGGVRQELEQLQLKLPAVPPPPLPPPVALLGPSLAARAAALGASGLPGAPGRGRGRAGGGGARMGTGLGGLRQSLALLAQLGLAVGAVSALGELLEAIEPQIPPLAQRFQLPPD